MDRNRHRKPPSSCKTVALLAEGVDRNWRKLSPTDWKRASPTTRRAWIEIKMRGCCAVAKSVALLAEGVDRNRQQLELGILAKRSPSSRRAWIEIRK